MDLRDYQWFNNPRGLISSGAMEPFILERFTRPQMGWAKLVVSGPEMISTCYELIGSQCMPIVSITGLPNRVNPPEDWFNLYSAYVAAGARYFEMYDAPNRESDLMNSLLADDYIELTWENTAEVIGPLMDAWITWAERIIALGGYPGFLPLDESAERPYATVYWQNSMLQYLRLQHASRMQAVVANGLWCATYPYVHNHFYQEPPGGPAHIARPYYQQSADEPGWHFEYPYDPLQQKSDPGRTVFGGTKESPYGEPSGLIAAGQSFQELMKKHFGAGPVPVIGTAGGIWPIPQPTEPPYAVDPRYPPYSAESHAEATLAMFEWIARQGPPWFWGVTLSDETTYYDAQGTVPAMALLSETTPIRKKLPGMQAGGGAAQPRAQAPAPPEPQPPQPERIIREAAPPEPEPIPSQGPRLIEGAPDYHWLILSPSMETDSFFETAARYWQTFRPTIVPDASLIHLVSPAKSLAVTLIGDRSTAEAIRSEWPTVLIDVIPFDTIEALRSEMERRATQQQRFG